MGLSEFRFAETTHRLASFVDITARKQAEAALHAAYAELQEKNIELQRQSDDRIRRIHAEAATAEAEAARERSACSRKRAASSPLVQFRRNPLRAREAGP